MADAHFHGDRHHGCCRDGCEKGGKLVNEERSEQEHGAARFVAIYAVGKNVEGSCNDFLDEHVIMALVRG